MKKWIEDIDSRILPFAGAIIVMAAIVPYVLLGENIVVNYGDQLDGEIPGYILHAKYLFTGADSYPEMMNGISPNGLFPPAPLWVLFYKILPPLNAYVVCHIFCMMIAYLGMYICLRKLVKKSCIAVFCGILFAYLPLFSVYGLCQYGQPLLFYAFYLLYTGKHRLCALGSIVLYAFTSSLVLVGYAVLGFCGLFLLWLLIKHRLGAHRWLLIGWITLLCCYLAVNYHLLLQIFGVGSQRESHKEIIVRNGQNVWKSFCTVFYRGTLHTPTHQQVIVLFTAGVLLVGFVFYRRLEGQTLLVYRLLVSGFCFNLFCAFFYAIYQSEPIAQWRNHVGGVVKEFQIDRVYWLSVSVWYILLGLGLYLTWEWICLWQRERKHIGTVAGIVCMTLTLCVSAASTFYYSDLNKNLHRLRFGEAYKQITWKDFYAPDIFSQIDAFIGQKKSAYRTLSFGIYPAAPLYNGFYCLDGYSNNYDLSYLYQFREIIKEELMKSESLKNYYDTWGCRCYILSAELGIDHYLIAKDSRTAIEELSVNVASAKKMGAKYIFSAIKIPNAQELGIKLLREKPFETPDSYYAIYLYEL